MCEGASKQTPGLKILPRRDCAPRFEIPGSATARCPWLSCALIWVMLIVGQNSLEVILKMDGKL